MTYDPDHSERRWQPWEIEEARERHPDRRSTSPAAGDRVWYRHDHFGDVTDAVVVDSWVGEVRLDPNVFDLDGGLVPDPWPVIRLQTMYGLLDTREARVRGSAGWLPIGWENA